SRELGNFGRAHEKPYAKLAGARFLPEANIQIRDTPYSTYLSNHRILHFEWHLSISDSPHHQIGPDVTAFKPVLRNNSSDIYARASKDVAMASQSNTKGKQRN